MENLGIFFIFTVVSLLYPSTASLARNDYDDAFKEVNNLVQRTDRLSPLINAELIYFATTHKSKVDEVIKRYNITPEAEVLTTKITEISETDIEPESKATECVPVALKSVKDAVTQYETSSDKCSSKAYSVSNEIIANIQTIQKSETDVSVPLKSELAQCVSNGDELQKTKCLKALADNTKPKVDAVERTFNTEKETMCSTARNSINELEKCYKEIPNFSTQNEDIIEKFKTCIKENAATNIYSTNIIYFCLCLYALLRISS